MKPQHAGNTHGETDHSALPYGRPRDSFDVRRSPAVISLGAYLPGAGGTVELELRGYMDDELVARFRRLL